MIKRIKNYLVAGLTAVSLAIPALANAHQWMYDDNGRIPILACGSIKDPDEFLTRILYDGTSPIPHAVVTDNFQDSIREELTFDVLSGNIVLKRQPMVYDANGKPIQQGDTEIYHCDALVGICLDQNNEYHKIKGYRIEDVDDPESYLNRSLEGLCKAIRSNDKVPVGVKNNYSLKGTICQ